MPQPTDVTYGQGELDVYWTRLSGDGETADLIALMEDPVDLVGRALPESRVELRDRGI